MVRLKSPMTGHQNGSFPSAVQYIGVQANSSMTIFDDAGHTTWQGSWDNSSGPGWQSLDAEIDAVGAQAVVPEPMHAGALG